MTAHSRSDHDWLMSLLASLTLCDHMGDVADDVLYVMRHMGIAVDDELDWDEGVRRALAERAVRTLYDTAISDD